MGIKARPQKQTTVYVGIDTAPTTSVEIGTDAATAVTSVDAGTDAATTVTSIDVGTEAVIMKSVEVETEPEVVVVEPQSVASAPSPPKKQLPKPATTPTTPPTSLLQRIPWTRTA